MTNQTQTQPSKALTILCFGDSLTEGYSQYGMKMTPYATATSAFLSEQLEYPSGSQTEIQICVEGKSGELVTNGFLGRMERLYARKNENDDPFTWLIFLGGTNDLGWGKPVDDIWDAIMKVIDIPKTRDQAKVLMCTIPECRVKSAKLDAKRDELNERIRNGEGWYVLDLNQKIPYHSMPEQERDEIWDDGLHFTEEGYERVGLLVGRRLQGIIERGEGRSDE